ncbi:uncharacterized protein TNCT_495411 [Trichonephila clavata]|uniref:Pre-C2HC domain-containing protein n=1 Tax=Trichonephila clavata TaxID=2740835 RepID=A0A8X6IDV7_TRICU|nr:uncharacterized protein TNCT_495411 [Trichonephila clavata]
MTKEIPINQVICTTKNNYAVLENEQPTTGVSDPPTHSTPKIKPVMMKITKNYNLILQEINQKYPAKVNKATGDWIKIQCATSDDHREITNSLVEKKIEHWVVDPIANRHIKVVIKGLPASTTVDEIEHDLKEKRVAVEKIAQLCKFKTQAPLHIFMVEVKRVENATDIYDIKVVCFINVTIDLSVGNQESK